MKPLLYLFPICLAGCMAPQDLTYTPPDQLTATHAGISLERGRHAAQDLTPGQTTSAVHGLLGEPDETSVGTAGQDLGTPWQALVWTYHWKSFTEPKTLQIMFQQESAGWAVNSWHWYNF